MRDWNGGIVEVLNRKFRVARNGEVLVRPIVRNNNDNNGGRRGGLANARRGGGRGADRVEIREVRIESAQPVIDARRFILDEAVDDNNFEDEDNYSTLTDESLPDLTQFDQAYD